MEDINKPVINKLEKYVGICGACFEPIEKGEEIQFRDNGKFFHSFCAETKPNSYYLALERIRGAFERGENLIDLIQQLEQLFGNQGCRMEEEVMELYNDIAAKLA